VGGTNFEDTLHPGTYHCLLVELGALGKKNLCVEVLDLEEAGSTLGPAANELACLYFGKVLPPEVFRKVFADRRLQFEDRADFRIADAYHPVVQDCFKANF